MSHGKRKSNCYCVGGLHFSSTVYTDADTTKTGRRPIVGKVLSVIEENSMAMNVKTTKIEDLRHLVDKIGQIMAKARKILASVVVRKPGGASDIRPKRGNALENTKAALSCLPGVIVSLY